MVFNNLNFAGVNSIDYGIYITGEAVYNVPERSVEFVSIAGRDGDLILDNGHFENIEVTYPAGCFGEDQTSFADKVRAFRNAIASKKGYQRLTDSYNPNEYRLATFVNGVEVDPTSYGRAGEFELVFNCQPFRYLMSGESEIEVASGSKIANPTPFESKPLIEVEGYGTLNIGEYEIELEDAVLGEVDVTERTTYTRAYLNMDLFNIGDTVTAKVTIGYQFVSSGVYADSFALVSGNASIKRQGNVLYITFTAPFTSGSSSSSTLSAIVRASIKGTTTTDNVTINATIGYHSAVGGDDIYASATTTSASGTFVAARLPKMEIQAIADSTIPILGHPTYIDCDIGQAYRIVDGEIYSLDSHIDLGSDLPILDVGETEITFDNTMTSVKIVPRWRQI